jgi:hypothetical protein
MLSFTSDINTSVYSNSTVSTVLVSIESVNSIKDGIDGLWWRNVRIKDSIEFLVFSTYSIIVDLFYKPGNEHWITCVQLFSNEISIRQGQIMPLLLLPMCLNRSHSSINHELIYKYYLSIHTHTAENDSLLSLFWKPIYKELNQQDTHCLLYQYTTLTHLLHFFQLSIRGTK